VKTIQLKSALSEQEVEAMEGDFVGADSYDICATEDTHILKPDGSTLLIYIRHAIPRSACEAAFETFKAVDVESGGTNRGMAAGKLEHHEVLDSEDGVEMTTEDGSATRWYPIKEDGSVSKTARAIAVPTGIIGYYDRYPRINYCRQTAFNMSHPELWIKAVPYIQMVSGIFKEHAPLQWEAQHEFIKCVHPDFVIPDTIFTTLTINHSWRTALHTDKGDFRSGLGCMTAFEGGRYSGGELIFPRYRAAVDMRTGGICLADVHEFHGNNEIIGTPGQYIRVSAVFYARESMSHCGSREFELGRAKAVGDQVSTRHGTIMGKLF
jgi:hypothetical protein